MLAAILTNILYAVIPVLTGQAFNIVLQGSSARSKLPGMALILLAVVLVAGCVDLSARFFPELLGKRITRDAQAELYLSLLGKSQTFHNRQRVGDIHHRPPPVYHSPCRSHHRAGSRSHRRGGQSQRVNEPGRSLCSAVQHLLPSPIAGLQTGRRVCACTRAAYG